MRTVNHDYFDNDECVDGSEDEDDMIIVYAEEDPVTLGGNTQPFSQTQSTIASRLSQRQHILSEPSPYPLLSRHERKRRRLDMEQRFNHYYLDEGEADSGLSPPLKRVQKTGASTFADLERFLDEELNAPNALEEPATEQASKPPTTSDLPHESSGGNEDEKERNGSGDEGVHAPIGDGASECDDDGFAAQSTDQPVSMETTSQVGDEQEIRPQRDTTTKIDRPPAQETFSRPPTVARSTAVSNVLDYSRRLAGQQQRGKREIRLTKHWPQVGQRRSRDHEAKPPTSAIPVVQRSKSIVGSR
jgi:hypothetical protein